MGEIDEREASLFAMELLMPEPMLLEDSKGLKIDLLNDRGMVLKKLALKYCVSERLMLFRLTQIGFFK